jgi:iron complex outermembrane receptor protein
MRLLGTGLFTVTALLAAGVSSVALAQSAAPGSTTVLDTITVEGKTLSGVEQARRRLKAVPGGVSSIQPQADAGPAVPTLAQVLSSAPGVVVQRFFGGNDQPRIQIRGSGLQQNPVERGILVLKDGLPINRADGSYIVGLANPGQASLIEVYRGYTANRLGASVLGGAINFASPVEKGTTISAGGGSFGQADVSARTGFDGERFAAGFYADVSRRDGFRDYNGSRRVNVGGVVEAELSDIVKTRIFASYTDLGFDVAGPLNKTAMEANPQQVSPGPPTSQGPNVIRDKPRREASQFLIGSRTSIELEDHLFDIGLGYTYTKDMFRFPVSSGVRRTEGGDVTGLLRYAYQPDASALLPLFETSVQYTVGSSDRTYNINRAGGDGPAFSSNDLDASTLSLNAGLNIPLSDTVTLSPSLSYTYATRDSEDLWTAATRPRLTYGAGGGVLSNVAAVDTSYERSYSGWSPAIAASWRPDENNMLFAALSRSFEPPTHDDLLGTTGGTPNASPTGFSTPDLDAQTATTVEMGWRGERGLWTFDATAYYSWVDNELLSLRDSSGSLLAAFNADNTTHAGLELGVSGEIIDGLTARVGYVLQDFRFHDDPVRGNNRLAGAPRHVVNLALQYALTEQWDIGAALQWVPSKTPVDNMNTVFADPYAVVDVKSEYRINDTLSVYGAVTNVFDKTYASSTLILDQASAGQAVYLPGDGRAFYAGIKARF